MVIYFGLAKQSKITITQAFTTLRHFVKVGDKIPVNYLKDEKVPVALKDEEYPTWLFEVPNKGATKQELMQKLRIGGVHALSVLEMKRLKRLIGLDQIRTANAAKVAEK